MNKQEIIEKIVDFLLGRAIEKLVPVDPDKKPGLYKLPEFEILGKKLNLGERNRAKYKIYGKFLAQFSKHFILGKIFSLNT